jgi:hypothetical protein
LRFGRRRSCPPGNQPEELHRPTTPAEGIFPSFKAVAVLTAIVFIALFAIVPFVVAILAATRSAAQQTGAVADDASPIYGVTVPPGYRQWELIAPAKEAAPLNELRAILGNKSAIELHPVRLTPA